jgi:hypothetical protein
VFLPSASSQQSQEPATGLAGRTRRPCAFKPGLCNRPGAHQNAFAWSRPCRTEADRAAVSQVVALKYLRSSRGGCTLRTALTMEQSLTTSQTPFELEIVATGRPRLVQSLRELWAYRGTILAFAERDIRVKYKQAVLGVAWAQFQPRGFLDTFGGVARAARLWESGGGARLARRD